MRNWSADLGCAEHRATKCEAAFAAAFSSRNGRRNGNSRESNSSTFRIKTVCFDSQGNEFAPEGILDDVDTGSAFATFAIINPAIQNTRVDMSPYGQSVFADATDALESVDLAFDALVSEVDLSKMRIFLSDVMFDREPGKKDAPPVPFGKGDCTIFRKVMGVDDLIKELAPALCTSQQSEVFRVALQMLGDLCGFGLTYFDFDSSGRSPICRVTLSPP